MANFPERATFSQKSSKKGPLVGSGKVVPEKVHVKVIVQERTAKGDEAKIHFTKPGTPRESVDLSKTDEDLLKVQTILNESKLAFLQTAEHARLEVPAEPLSPEPSVLNPAVAAV